MSPGNLPQHLIISEFEQTICLASVPNDSSTHIDPDSTDHLASAAQSRAPNPRWKLTRYGRLGNKVDSFEKLAVQITAYRKNRVFL